MKRIPLEVIHLRMGRNRHDHSATQTPEKELRLRAEQITRGERCLHCNREFLDLENTELTRSNSDVRIHKSCRKAFNGQRRLDWTTIEMAKI
jgi:hypothetical protein